MAIPTKFECMGSTVTVALEACETGADGHYHGGKARVSISPECNEQAREQTFWHEFMHCALTHLGYSKLNDNEQFIDQMAQCLYQLQKSRVDRKRK